MNEIRAVVFDAYGTLLDVHSAMARHAARLGADWAAISADWRRKQLEYSWVLSLAGPGHHRDFWTLTEAALRWAAERHDVTDQALLGEVLMAYRHLDAYPEVPSVLGVMKDMSLPVAILSNGAPEMLAAAVRAARIERLLDRVLSVEAVGIFKPDPRVYRLAADWAGQPAAQVAFVSSNAWDVFGARAFGFRAIWVNRGNDPAEYDLASHISEIGNLTALPAALA